MLRVVRKSGTVAESTANSTANTTTMPDLLIMSHARARCGVMGAAASLTVGVPCGCMASLISGSSFRIGQRELARATGKAKAKTAGLARQRHLDQFVGRGLG